MSYRLIDANALNGIITEDDYDKVLEMPYISADLPNGLDGQHYNLKQQSCEDAVEVWDGIHCQIVAPKGTFDKIYNDAEENEKAISIEGAIKVIKSWFEKIELNPDILIDSIISLPSVTPTSKDDARLKFLEFLYNTINPNEMETYMGMFKATDDKAVEGVEE